MRTPTHVAPATRDNALPPADTVDTPQPRGAPPAPPAALESRGQRLRRHLHQGRLHGSALAVVALLAVLVALAATNTARVRVDWLLGSSRVSLVWLVLAAALIGWILGVLASARFQWLTRPPRTRRPARGSQAAPPAGTRG